MADDQPQQTRVLLLNGQTIILQGDGTDNSVNEIDADLLRQALQEAEEPRNEDFHPPPQPLPPPPQQSANENPPNQTGNNLVAIFQGDQGETHTIQLTMEQAEALGLHFMSDEPETLTVTPDLPSNVSTPQMTIPNDRNQLMYSNNTSQPEGQKSMFDTCLNSENNISKFQDNSTSLPGDNTNSSTNLPQNIEGLSALSGVGSFMGDPDNITLIPQFVNGQMSYTVKLNNEQPSNMIPNQDFSVMNHEENSDQESMCEQKTKISLLAPSLSVNSLTTNTLTPTVSASTTPVSSIRINNIPTMMNSLTPVAPSLTHTTAIQKTTPLTSILAQPEKTPKYVVVPTSCTPTSVSTACIVNPVPMKGTSLMRAIARPITQAPLPLNSSKTSVLTTSTSSSLPSNPSTTSTLTGIPLINSNINITRTSVAGNSLLQSVSSSITGGGMIRVVAGGAATRMVQVPSTNGPKFTNILTPSGRLVTAGNAMNAQQKYLTVNSTSGITKTTSATTTAMSTNVTTTEPLQTRAVNNTMQSTAARLSINSTKPLGSSENPIQLVQQGQTFHSVQALSQEQLRQIATVLQQQHLDSAPRTKNVLYDAETNTRIIYRVVYPEDLDLREPSSPSEKHISSGLGSSTRGRGRRGRPPKIAGRPVGRCIGAIQDSSSPSVGRKPVVDLDLDEDRLIDDATKCERKKQVARTRSGRLSRPPRHMVKDYKRLHHLDFADADLDDSDGGYSDYQMSDREAEEQEVKTGSVPAITQGTGGIPGKQDTGGVNPVGTTTLLPGLQVSKRKISSHFRCPTCQKVYLGHSRMSRHFDMFPEHGSIDQMRTSMTTAPSSPMPLPDSTQGKVGIGSTMNGIVRPTGGRRRGKRRGPWAYTTPEARSERRKIKLREAISTCEASELSEVAGPAVAGVMSMWELLLLRVETVRSGESLMATLCEELRALLEKVQSVAGDVMQPLHSEDVAAQEEQIELQDEILCNALGLPSGKYQIVDDHLLTRRSQIGAINKIEPPMKRFKSEESFKGELKQEETKPSCPEVLSALALESRPTIVSLLTKKTLSPTITTTKAINSHPSSPSKSPTDGEHEKTSEENTPLSQDESMKDDDDDLETKQISDQDDDHPFLLPTTTDMCVDELSHEPVGGDHHGTETVDDIVNERLKNLTGFSVSVPESEPVPSTNLPVNQFQNSHNSTVPEVPTFDPEIALAAMGEGDQPETGASLTEFTPEIALAAMGEGDNSASENAHQHGPFAPSIQPVFDSIKSMKDDVPGSTHTSPSHTEIEHPETARSPHSASEVFSSMELSNMNTSCVENSSKTKEDIVAFTTSILTNSENTFITSLAESVPNKCSGVTDSSVTNFDPEIALAAMGEGEQPDSNAVIHSQSSFDPEMALVSMGEGVSSEPNVPPFQPERESSASDTAFQLTGMDVSLDESGPELDFDALSAEFTRSTPHS